ncbi:MAG: UDP-glucose/GDP-mannose dehydrogenase family protein [Bacteriovoracaceae bacterium]|nr:UDP-glucose/GDP-mannose dehydrogenase family protein [Bacteriovoracaceae bacterium]
MKVAIIGCGYVGLPSGVGLAELGNDVICIDQDAQRISELQQGRIPLYEEDLPEMFTRNVALGRLKFTTSMQEGVTDAEVVIIAVGTPPHPVTHEADLKFVYSAATELAVYLKGYTVIATKSTVPVATGDSLETLLRAKNPHAEFDVVSFPEFLREGHALYDFLHPDRIVVGTDSAKACAVIKKLYAQFDGQDKFIFVKRRSAEVIKYAANSFLAMKIHYINEMANFCEKTGADIQEVARGMGADSRIGAAFLRPGPGFGGSCFPKDTLALAFMAQQNGVNLDLVNATIEGNQKRKEEMAAKILQAVHDIDQPRVAVWGLAFKNGTDDCRESPAIEIIKHLLQKKIKVTAYDPQGMQSAQHILGSKIAYASGPVAAAQDADVLAVLTEWPSFKQVDLGQLAAVMRGKLIIDTRNILEPTTVVRAGFAYQGVGISLLSAAEQETAAASTTKAQEESRPHAPSTTVPPSV